MPLYFRNLYMYFGITGKVQCVCKLHVYIHARTFDDVTMGCLCGQCKVS